MDEVEGTIFEGDRAIVSDAVLLLDVLHTPEGSTEAPGWHAHVALPLSTVLEPGVQMRLETTDGRSGLMSITGPPIVEGDRVLHVFTGIGPLVKQV